MYSKKEDFLNQLQFELGHRWPDVDFNSLPTIDSVADFILEKYSLSKWPFLRFLPFYFDLKIWIENKRGNAVSLEFDLNSLTKPEKTEIAAHVEANYAKPIAFRRPTTLKTIVFLSPIFLVLVPLLISTYLITAKELSGWLYLSAAAGILLFLGLIKITTPLKKYFDPPTLLEYSKSFYVIHNQTMHTEPSKQELCAFLCASAEKFYGHPFTADSELPIG